MIRGISDSVFDQGDIDPVGTLDSDVFGVKNNDRGAEIGGGIDLFFMLLKSSIVTGGVEGDKCSIDQGLDSLSADRVE